MLYQKMGWFVVCECYRYRKERIEFLKANPIGKIIQCTCNDILDSNSKEGYSLFLGRAKASVSDLRFDKMKLTHSERILEIFASVGLLKTMKLTKGKLHLSESELIDMYVPMSKLIVQMLEQYLLL